MLTEAEVDKFHELKSLKTCHVGLYMVNILRRSILLSWNGFHLYLTILIKYPTQEDS